MWKHACAGKRRSLRRNEYDAIEPTKATPLAGRWYRHEYEPGRYHASQTFRKLASDVATAVLQGDNRLAQRAIIRSKGLDRKVPVKPRAAKGTERLAAPAQTRTHGVAGRALRREKCVQNGARVHASAIPLAGPAR